MRKLHAAAILGVLALAACATTAPIPAGMKAGSFVNYSCDDGKRLAARAAQDGNTVRIRSLEGGYELDRTAEGRYAGDGWTLKAMGSTVELEHGGKVVAKGCKPT